MVTRRVIWMADVSLREEELEISLMMEMRRQLMSSFRGSVLLRIFWSYKTASWWKSWEIPVISVLSAITSRDWSSLSGVAKGL
jgi:hypothetical protein